MSDSNSIKPNSMDGYSSRQRRRLEESNPQERISIEGINNDRKAEPIPYYRKAPCEEIAVNGQNNCQIITGRDRPHSLESGYGGRGDTRAGCMDIVVGRYIPPEGIEDEKGDRSYVNPNLEKDAARIYISQRTDIDQNFNIASGGVGKPQGRSGIAIKADGVRIIGREGIKLVTKTEDRNSLNGRISKIKGIDLIAGNRSSGLQPMAKGSNLLKYLKTIHDDMVSIVGMINSLATKQIVLDATLASHVHLTATGVTLPSLELAVAATTDAIQITAQDIQSHTLQLINSQATKSDYLKSNGSKYILSHYNKTN